MTTTQTIEENSTISNTARPASPRRRRLMIAIATAAAASTAAAALSFGAFAETAITYLQRDAGLPQTGHMNGQTQAALAYFLTHGNNHMGG